MSRWMSKELSRNTRVCHGYEMVMTIFLASAYEGGWPVTSAHRQCTHYSSVCYDVQVIFTDLPPLDSPLHSTIVHPPSVTWERLALTWKMMRKRFFWLLWSSSSCSSLPVIASSDGTSPFSAFSSSASKPSLRCRETGIGKISLVRWNCLLYGLVKIHESLSPDTIAERNLP